MMGIEPHMYRDVNGDRIEPGFLVTVPANLNDSGKPFQPKGIMICVGWHDELNKVFVRYTGSPIVHQLNPSKLQIITPTAKHRDIVRHRRIEPAEAA